MQNNNYVQSAITSPQGAANNIFVPGTMRFAVMNQRTNQNGGLTAQQQKIFEMNNNLHGVGMNAPLAMAFSK